MKKALAGILIVFSMSAFSYNGITRYDWENRMSERDKKMWVTGWLDASGGLTVYKSKKQEYAALDAYTECLGDFFKPNGTIDLLVNRMNRHISTLPDKVIGTTGNSMLSVVEDYCQPILEETFKKEGLPKWEKVNDRMFKT